MAGKQSKIPRKQLEEIRDAALELKGLMETLRRKEGVSKKLIKDLEKLSESYERRVLNLVFDINVKK